MKKYLLVLAFVITLFLFVTILLVGSWFSQGREAYINDEVQRLYNDLNEVQTFFLLSETYGDEMACLAFQQKLVDLDSSVWNLGIKLDQYRAADEQFRESAFFYDQKRIFNENELFYMTLLRKLKNTCGYDQVIVSFFYADSETCDKCDDQSFVLTDINKDIDESIALFSFDMDLGIPTLSLLREYYNITELPCVVIEEQPYCGMRDKAFLMERICEVRPETCGLPASNSTVES